MARSDGMLRSRMVNPAACSTSREPSVSSTSGRRLGLKTGLKKRSRGILPIMHDVPEAEATVKVRSHGVLYRSARLVNRLTFGFFLQPQRHFAWIGDYARFFREY